MGKKGQDYCTVYDWDGKAATYAYQVYSENNKAVVAKRLWKPANKDFV